MFRQFLKKPGQTLQRASKCRHTFAAAKPVAASQLLTDENRNGLTRYPIARFSSNNPGSGDELSGSEDEKQYMQEANAAEQGLVGSNLEPVSSDSTSSEDEDDFVSGTHTKSQQERGVKVDEAAEQDFS